jgi:hypothetical protein
MAVKLFEGLGDAFQNFKVGVGEEIRNMVGTFRSAIDGSYEGDHAYFNLLQGAANKFTGNRDQYNWERSFLDQQSENDIARSREDTAIERRVADMEAAGLNPMMLASGQMGPAASSRGSAAPARGSQGSASGIQLAMAIAQLEKDLSLKDSQKALLDAQADATRGGETRAEDLHEYSVTFASLKNAELTDKVRYLSSTFQDRIVEAGAAADASLINNVLGRQQVIFNRYNVDMKYRDNVRDAIELGIRRGQEYITLPMSYDSSGQMSTDTALAGGDWRREDRAVDVDWGGLGDPPGLTIRMHNIAQRTNPDYVTMLANQIALEAGELNKKLLTKEAAWFEVTKISQMLLGGAMVGSRYFPYMNTQEAPQPTPNPIGFNYPGRR